MYSYHNAPVGVMAEGPTVEKTDSAGTFAFAFGGVVVVVVAAAAVGFVVIVVVVVVVVVCIWGIPQSWTRPAGRPWCKARCFGARIAVTKAMVHTVHTILVDGALVEGTQYRR